MNLSICTSSLKVTVVIVTMSFITLVIDGGYSEWCSFTACSVTCGGGVSYRTRTCTGPPPENGGRSCDSLGPDIETQECNTEECRKNLVLYFFCFYDIYCYFTDSI